MRVLFFLFLLGQTVRMPLFGGGVTLLDIGVFVLDLLLLVRMRSWWPMVKSLPWIIPYCLFLFSLLLSLLLAAVRGEAISLFSVAYLVRFLLYQGVWVGAVVVGFHRQTFSTTLSAFAVIGLIQLLFLKDLTPLFPFGWDPHYGRLVGSMLDPNFSGWILAIGILFLEGNSGFSMLFRMFLLFALLLTFSRSSIGAFAFALAIRSALSRSLIDFVFLAVFAIFASAFFLSRADVEAERGIVRARSLEARLVTIDRALVLINKHALAGVGFNRFLDASVEEGLIDPAGQIVHSMTSADSGLLFLWATGGSISVVLYGWWMARLLHWLWSVPGGRGWIAAALGWILHGQIVNSLFFVPILFLMFCWLGIIIRSWIKLNRSDRGGAVAGNIRCHHANDVFSTLE